MVGSVAMDIFPSDLFPTDIVDCSSRRKCSCADACDALRVLLCTPVVSAAEWEALNLWACLHESWSLHLE